MRIDGNIKTALNSVMASDQNTVLLFAPEDYNKSDFISGLTEMYYKYYTFTAVVDDLQELCTTVAERVLTDEPELLLRLRQLLFCQSRYNGPRTVLKAVLNYIEASKRDVLFVFEDLEELPKDFDYTYFIYLINHAPQNLKIVLSSDVFLPLGLYRFEPKYPMVISDDMLMPTSAMCSYEEYIADLDEENVARLCFLAELPILSENHLSGFMPEASQMLRYLGRKGIYVSQRDRGANGIVYRLQNDFRDFLKSISGDYADLIAKYEEIDLYEEMLKAMSNGDDCFVYLRFALRRSAVQHAENAIKLIFNSPKCLPKLPSFLTVHKEYLHIKNPRIAGDNSYTRAFQKLLRIVYNFEVDECLEETSRLKEHFKETGDMFTYYILSSAECLAYDKKGNREKVFELIHEAEEFSKACEEHNYFGLVIRMLLPDFPRYSSQKPAELEELLATPEVKNAFWYFKALEDLEILYYTLGNYRKSLDIAMQIKELLSVYVIPPRIVAMSYYDPSDMQVVEQKVDDALRFSISNDLLDDTLVLYTAKSLICAYRGELDKAEELSNKSFELITGEDSVEKFFTIMIRVWNKARKGENRYAVDLANIYLNYTRARAPEYIQFMAAALSYALFKTGEIEESYELAREAIKTGANRSIAWLMSMGLATNYLLAKGELQDVNFLLGNIIKTASTHGMLRLLVEGANDIFQPILEYAKLKNIEPEIIEEIFSLIRIKTGEKMPAGNVKVNLFGTVSVTFNGEEIKWKTRKSKDLFLHYILGGKVGIERAVLLDTFWKDYMYESSINNLKTTNNLVRKTLQNYDINFKLTHNNTRYTITIENLEVDYVRFRELLDCFIHEPDVMRKADIMDAVLRIYKGDFAEDIHYPEFEHERVTVKQELVLNLIKLVRLLAKQGEYVDAKRFLNTLIHIDQENNYDHMSVDLDKYLKI